MSTPLFDGQSSNGTSSEFKHLIREGETPLMAVYLAGDLGGGSVAVQAKDPETDEFVPISGGEALDALGLHVIDAPSVIGRLELTDASSANLTASVESIHEAYIRVQQA